MIRTATGVATGAKLETLLAEALAEATRKFEAFELVPSLALVFLSPRFELDAALLGVRSALPSVLVVGCTTAGELSELGLTVGGISVMLLGGSGLNFQIDDEHGLARPPPSTPARASQRAQSILSTLKDKSELAADTSRLTSLILTDGMSPMSETIVGSLQGGSSTSHELFGAGAADEFNFRSTELGTSKSGAFNDGAIAVHFLSSSHWGIGVFTGFSPTRDPLKVTRAEGNIVHELNGKPAFEFYRERAARSGIELEPQDASAYILQQPLGIVGYDQLRAIRMPFSVLQDGSIACTGDVPQGATVRLLSATSDTLVGAARKAAQTARERLGSEEAAGILVFDSVLVHNALEQDYRRVIDQVRTVFPDTPIAGFLCYGEVARYSGTLSGWHNGSTVVVAIPDCA